MKKNELRKCNGKRANAMKCLKITTIYFLMSDALFAVGKRVPALNTVKRNSDYFCTRENM
jgi:hypothetical protein